MARRYIEMPLWDDAYTGTTKTGVKNVQYLQVVASGCSTSYHSDTTGINFISSEITYYPASGGHICYARDKPRQKQEPQTIEKIVYRDRVVEKPVEVVRVVEKPIYITKEVNMFTWSIWNILVVALICIVVIKFIIPRLTFRWVFSRFFRFIALPFRREKGMVIADWDMAKRNEEEREVRRQADGDLD